MDIKCSPITLDDLEDILILEPALFDHPFDRDAYFFEIAQNPYSHYYKLHIDDELIAYGGIQCLFDEAHLMTIGVKHVYQNEGLGRQLLNYLIDKAKEAGCVVMYLEVSVENESALNLYFTSGFKPTRLRPQYYGLVDAYEMKKELL